MSGLVVYRCHACNWRGWAPERAPAVGHPQPPNEEEPFVLKRTGALSDEAFDALEDERRRR